MVKGTNNTAYEFECVRKICREIFEKKMQDYGTSWRIMRPSSITDQIMIKARRIRSLEEKGGVGKIHEGVEPEYIGIINYCIMGLIQLSVTSEKILSEKEISELYDKWFAKATSLMTDKNHDYDEAWRDMLVTSFTDIILQKLMRTRSIELHNGNTIISEGVDANYMDMVNYAAFALIKLGLCKR